MSTFMQRITPGPLASELAAALEHKLAAVAQARTDVTLTHDEAHFLLWMMVQNSVTWNVIVHNGLYEGLEGIVKSGVDHAISELIPNWRQLARPS